MDLKLRPVEAAILKVSDARETDTGWVQVHLEYDAPYRDWKSPVYQALRRRGFEVRMKHHKHGVAETFARWPKGGDCVQD